MTAFNTVMVRNYYKYEYIYAPNQIPRFHYDTDLESIKTPNFIVISWTLLPGVSCGNTYNLPTIGKETHTNMIIINYIL